MTKHLFSIKMANPVFMYILTRLIPVVIHLLKVIVIHLLKADKSFRKSSCHPGVGVRVRVCIRIGCFGSSFLHEEQGAVRRAILYADRPCLVICL